MKPLYAPVGIYVPFLLNVADVGLDSMHVPSTPKIVTPDFILPSAMFASIDEVTGFTVNVPKPEYPFGTVIDCELTLGLIVFA